MLSTPWDQRKNVYDFIIIGSGYGGAITAARLATAKLTPQPSICILERGKEWEPGTFPESTPDVIGATRSGRVDGAAVPTSINTVRAVASALASSLSVDGSSPSRSDNAALASMRGSRTSGDSGSGSGITMSMPIAAG